jgi:non-ribosomal peptide synthase protein (TIGR01720 family)
MEQTSSLIGVATAYGDRTFTVDDILIAALAVVVSRRLGHPHLGVMLEGHGREDSIEPGVDLTRTVGWFTTLFPVELRSSDPDDARSTLDEIRDQLRRVPERGIGFGVDRYLGAADELESPEPPIVAFNYLGQLDRTIRAATPFTAVGDMRAGIALRNRRTHLLGILAVNREGRLTITVDYLPDHLDPEAAAALADDLVDTIVWLAEAASTGRRREGFELLDQSDTDAARLRALLDQFE